jgi:LPS O-antigen subunit length determinant protein (WzzB/FepE family)
MSDSNNQPNPNHSEDEIDLIALAKTLWEGRRTIIKTVVIFAVLGLFIAIFSQKEYTATTTMVPQVNNPSSKLGRTFILSFVGRV